MEDDDDFGEFSGEETPLTASGTGRYDRAERAPSSRWAWGALLVACALCAWPLDGLLYLRPSWLVARVRRALGGGITLVALSPLGAHMEASWRGRHSRDESGWPADADARRRIYEANWRCYARLHGYRLEVATSDQVARHRFAPAPPVGAAPADPRQWPAPYKGFWAKLEIVERALASSSWVVYFDADVVFVALPERLEAVLARAAGPDTDLVVLARPPSDDPADAFAKNLINCIFAVRNSAGGRWFLRRWFALREREASWSDQGPYHHAVIEMHMRYNATRAARPFAAGAAPPWHDAAYDGVESPCLPPHWTLSPYRPKETLACMASAMRRLDDRPRANVRTDWPVGWSTELGVNLGIFDRDATWEARKAKVNALIGRGGGGAPPALMGHSKTGVRHPLLTMMRVSPLLRLAKLCPAPLALVNASAFVDEALLGALHGADPFAWRLWRALPAKWVAPWWWWRDV